MNADHPLGPLVPVGRFDWERILGRCKFKPRTSAKLVAFALATWADLETGTRIHPGNKRIELRAGLAKDSVIDGLQMLQEVGLIHKVSNGSSYGRSAKASEFRLTAPEGLAESYREEWNVNIWDDRQTWNVENLLEQVGSSTPDLSERFGSSGHVPTVETLEQVGSSAEQVGSSSEQVGSSVETGRLNRTPSTYVSTHESSNQSIKKSSAFRPNATLRGDNEIFDLNDESQNLSEEQNRQKQMAYLQKMIELEKVKSA
ncbi:hypothetical protein [Glutamicibacter ardleyensis]|uniref:hypothetical protein n=1 Tax=Glutamicibacter ardleyensis TaxID=225894 RepID=UPI001665118E|nr:hypothetical protein [Glutamicibacter ardleyensis]